MIYYDTTKYRTKAAVISTFKRLAPPLKASTQATGQQSELDVVASGNGGVEPVPQGVALEDGAASPDVDVGDVHGGAGRPASITSVSPGKAHLDLRDGEAFSVANYVRDINGNWKRGVDAFLNIARLCAEANACLTTAQKLELMSNLPFREATFSKFVQIGSDTRLHTPEIQRLLPPHYTTIYSVTLLTDQELSLAIAENVIHPDMQRAQLERWRKSHFEKVVVAPIPIEAESHSAVASPPIALTQDAVEGGALRSTMSDDNLNSHEQLAVAPEDAPAPGAVATAAGTKGPLTPPPGDDDIPAFLDRRPLSAEDQRMFDMIMAALHSASEVVRERVRAELMRDVAFSSRPD